MLGADKYVSIGNRTKINPFRHHGQNRNLRQALIQASKKLSMPTRLLEWLMDYRKIPKEVE